MDAEGLRELVRFGRERTGVEFKGPGAATDRNFLAKVIRAMLAMSNRRDGGTVIVGVEESGGGLELRGLTGEALSTWRYDEIADKVDRYADPNINFELEELEVDRARCLVIEVQEFVEVPTICAKSFGSVLHEGDIYVRPRRKPESARVQAYADMRDLVDLAVDKAVKAFVRRTSVAGLATAEPMPPPTSDAEKFRAQGEDF